MAQGTSQWKPILKLKLAKWDYICDDLAINMCKFGELWSSNSGV